MDTNWLVTFFTDRHRHQHSLAHHLAGAPHLLIARVDHQVPIGVLQTLVEPRAQLQVQLLGSGRHLAPAHFQTAQRLGDRAHLARRYPLDVHQQHRLHQRLLAARVALEQLGLELAFPILGHQQLQLAHPRLQHPRLEPAPPAPPLPPALVTPRAQKARHLRFQNLLHNPLHQAAKKIFFRNALPALHDPNTVPYGMPSGWEK